MANRIGYMVTSTLTYIERPITFNSRGNPRFRLEGILHEPVKAEHAPVIILCHPQPASSNMHDVLTLALARRLAGAGMIALRFNFRGVGNSQGQQTDHQAACV